METKRAAGRGRYVFEQFTAVRRYQPTLAFSPDGSEVAYSTNTSGQFNLWRQSSGGGYAHQVTTLIDRTVRDVAWSPDGETILFTSDRDGDEFHQLFTIPARGGWPRQLTDAPRVQHYLAGEAWSPDGRTIAYAGNDRDPADQDVLVCDVASGEVRRVLAGGATYFPDTWSPAGTELTVLEAKSGTDSEVHLVVVADGSSRHLTPHEGDAKYYPGPWAADGAGFYLLTDEGREFLGLAFQDVRTGERRWVETPDWDVEAVAASADGRVLIWTVNEAGYSRLHGRDLATGDALRLPDLPEGVVWRVELARSGDKLGLFLDRPRHPMEVFVVDLTTSRLNQLTHGFLGGIDEADLIQPDLAGYLTFDGRRIPAFLYRPRGDGPFPVVLSIHGGPEAQERPRYDELYQYWLDRGIAVLVPNIRGSTGYGKSYQKLIHHDWGGGDLGDLEAAVGFLRSLDWVAPGHIGVFGGSYGGFAVLSCVSRLPDYWAAAVEWVGPSNLVTMIETAPPTWRRMDEAAVGNPTTEADFLMARSPVTYADRIRTPLFIVQGARDPRTPKTESDQIVERLRARGIPVRYDVYEDEGHGFTKRENELKALRDSAAFMEEHLL